MGRPVEESQGKNQTRQPTAPSGYVGLGASPSETGGMLQGQSTGYIPRAELGKFWGHD